MSCFSCFDFLVGDVNDGKLENEEGAMPNGIDLFYETYDLSKKVLGKGAFAEVRLATHKQTEQDYAVKVFEKLEMPKSERKGLRREIQVMQKLNHPNIVKFHEYYENDEYLLIVMDYIQGGELFEQLAVKDNYSELESKRIIRKLAEALKHCSDRGVVHRDLKPENILLRSDDKSAEIVLADFGFAFDMAPELKGFDLLQTMCGTASYVAPEVIRGKPYNYKCDIWSLGVISYILLSGGYTIYSGDQQAVLRQVKRGEWDFKPQKAWKNVSDDAKDLLRHILVKSPSKRYNYESILAHKWFERDNEEQSKAILKVDDELAKFNIRRKLYAIAKAKQAADHFGDLLMSSKQQQPLNDDDDDENEANDTSKTDDKEPGVAIAALGMFQDMMDE